MEALGCFGKLPRPGWPNVAVVVTRRLRGHYGRRGRDAFVADMARSCGVAARKLVENPERWVIATRATLIPDLKAAGVRPGPDDAWSFAMWRDYLDNQDGTKLAVWFRAGGARGEHIHTSGHASQKDLHNFARTIGARVVIPVHGKNWEAHASSFAGVHRLADGEVLVV